MDKIIIQKCVTGDTRTSDGPVSKELLKYSSLSHIYDVQKAMTFLVKLMLKAASEHDHTKIDHLDAFYKDFYDTKTKKFDFEKDGDWYRYHISEERYHLNEHVPNDVNLIDVLEMCCDCTMAGLARSGSFTPFELSNEVLQRAVANTCKLLVDNTEVKK